MTGGQAALPILCCHADIALDQLHKNRETTNRSPTERTKVRYGEAMAQVSGGSDMWYVIQTRTGYESELVRELEQVLAPDSYRQFLIPMFEEVLRTGGVSRISLRKIFPGYVLVETDTPECIIPARRILLTREFVRLLGTEGAEEDKIITPVGAEDVAFLESVLTDGVMSVSYVEHENSTKIRRIVGPLARYGNHITKIEFRRRRAIVDAKIFGKQRRIKFGLWAKEDPEIPWITEALKNNDQPEFLLDNYDIGLHTGDRVRYVGGMFGDEIFTVERVNVLKRTIRVKGEILGGIRNLELPVDQLEKIEEPQNAQTL